MDRILVAVDLETTGYEPETEEIVEIGAIRMTVSPDGAVTLGERFLTFADPGRPLTPPIVRLTEEYARYYRETHAQAKKYTEWAKNRPHK